MTKEQISKRYQELAAAMKTFWPLQQANGFEEIVNHQNWSAWTTSALNIIAVSFGADSVHFSQLQNAIASAMTHSKAVAIESARGVFVSAKDDFEGGYVSSLARGIAGEVFGSLLNSASTALKEGYKDSAAVLAAAAFEDSLKKIAALHGLNVADQELGNVIGALKAQQLIQGGAAKSAERYQNFRNWAMHANWEKITQEEVGGLIGFVEQLLIKHLS